MAQTLTRKIGVENCTVTGPGWQDDRGRGAAAAAVLLCWLHRCGHRGLAHHRDAGENTFMWNFLEAVASVLRIHLGNAGKL